ncbi:MAG: fibronectin type III domain-containing protein [Deltaproteobacteria bacterium]|nr:fibronectin type III domain-containing protein [Deltaproteobacteria bacterium]
MMKQIARAARGAAAAVVAVAALAAGQAQAAPNGLGTSYIPGRVGVRGTVPNPGTQQQELANITFPAPYNVFEFTVTCAGCHGGAVDQQVAHFGVQSGTAMASSARDPVFRANQIAVNNILRALTGEDGAGNMCFRCHSPNGWYSGRFDPTLGGDPEGRTMMHSIVLSTDDEGISCEQCHRVAGAVTFQKPGLPATTQAFNLLAGIGGYPADPGWPHDGGPFVDQAGTPTVHAGAPFGDTSLQYNEGMSYNGPYSGMVSSTHSDVPPAAWGATDYTGQIFAVHPATGLPVVNVDGSVAPTYESPIGAPITDCVRDPANPAACKMPFEPVYDYQAQSLSIEHPTYANGFLTKSEFCGSCHDLTVPVLNHGMPEQRTYTEWKFSAYSQPGASTTLGIPVATKRTQAGEVRCQDCHMPQVKHEFADDAPSGLNADPLLAGWFPYAKDRNLDGGTSSHKHAGANRDLGAMMKVLYPEPDMEVLGVSTGNDPRIFPGMNSTRDAAYVRNVRNTEISMADAVKLTIVSGPTETAAGSGVYQLQVRVDNRTGHRVPTGYPDGRRMWISLGVTDAAGATVYQSGLYDAAESRLYTDASGTFARAQSNVIDATVANAVMVYERVTCRDGLVPGAPLFDGARDGICEDPGSPFLPNNTIMFDNRIPPAGFTYADYRTGGIKFWNYTLAPNPNAGGALRPVPCEDAPGFPAAIGGSCAAATAPRYADGQGYDLVTYRFAAAPGQALVARAQIQWQTHTREFMETLRDQQESLGLVDGVRPEGPINPTMLGYPLAPAYLSDVINLASIQDPYPSALSSGTSLRDNWGGIAYAAWLLTGKGAPATVAVADSSVTAAPPAPADVAAAATPGVPYEATISWSAVAGADGYLVSILYGCPTRAQNPDGSFVTTHCYDATLDAGLPEVSTVGVTTTWDRLAVVPASACDATTGVCEIVNTAMNVNKSYGFKVQAFNAAGHSADSATITYKSPWDIPLPAELLRLVSLTTTSATLAWTDTADNETIFVVQLVPVAAPQPPLSAALTPTPDGLGVVPTPAPEVLTVFATQTPGATGFGGNQQTVAGLLPDTAYNVQVQACNATACSGMNLNGPIQFRTSVALAAPILNTPAIVRGGTLSVDLAWNVVAGATSYVVERSLDGGATWSLLVNVAATSYSDASVAYSTTYSYRVSATNGANTSSASNVRTVLTPPVVGAPTIGTVSGPTSTRNVTVRWSYANQGQTGFSIQRALVTGGAPGAFAEVATAGAAARSVVNQLPALPADDGTANVYVYQVLAYVDTAEGRIFSDPSAASRLVTLAPPAPTSPNWTNGGVVRTAGQAGSLTVTFNDRSQNELRFTLERQLRSANGTWGQTTQIAVPAAAGIGPRTHVSSGLLSNRTYRFRVRASNDGGNSSWSSYQSASTN